MTAHRCCPGCGTELASDGTADCGCAGPFSAEHVDPMHIRPYVDLPESPEEGPAEPDLAPFARCGTGETTEMPVVPGIAGSRGERQGRPGEADGGSGSGGPGGVPARSAAARRDVRAGVREEVSGSHRRERRRPVTAALAAAGVVAALGAGLLVTQSLSDGDSGDERALSTDDRELPGMPSGAPTHGMPSEKRSPGQSASPSAAPSRTVEPTAPRADRADGGHTESPSAKSSASPAESARSSGSPSSASAGPGDASRSPGSGDTEKPPARPARPAGETLSAGDRGPQVAELQRRLKQAGYLDADVPEDGDYSAVVQEAVFRYQDDRSVQGDAPGDYGPSTRASLESHTTG